MSGSRRSRARLPGELIADRLEELLRSRREERLRPLHGFEIAEILGLSDERPVRAAAAILCERDVPVCSGDDGYWLARHSGDLDGTIHHLGNRAMKLLKRRSQARRMQRKMRAEEEARRTLEPWTAQMEQTDMWARM